MKIIKDFRVNQNNITIIATLVLFILLYSIGLITFPVFSKSQVFFNLLIDNAYLIIMATGLCFVIISGGIDLSIAALLALTTMVVADLLQKGLNPILVIIIALGVGTIFGFVQGYLIATFDLHPWIVTLGGMFFARGACYLISIQSIVITDNFFQETAKFRIKVIGSSFISVNVIIALLVVIIAIYVGKFTKFGRTVYAIGGNQKSALLMGLNVHRSKVLVYMISGFASAMSGIAFSFYMLSGYGLHCLGSEMDAIAACVVGGILLTGGFGYILGPTIGVLSMGTIQMLIMFQGNLSSWWTKIAVGMLLLIFIVLQRIIVIQREKQTVN
ncbi:MAG: sugar ABC transporter permease YjfF [Vallitaleaceae bacterium]|jgi:ribose/xylose/arabinose/galactoside ABC-type transport system permease subunit|nr:sugar ABC transporter permease YjfF [Vallitaleaceae bacterium]